MTGIFYRLTCLLLVLALAVAAAVIPEDQLAMASSADKYPAVVVIKSDAGQKEQITFFKTLIEAIDQAGIAIGDYDRLSLPENTLLEPGKRYDVNVTRLDEVRLNWSGYALATAGDFADLGDVLSRSGFSEIDTSSGSRIESTTNLLGENGEFVLNYVDIQTKIVREYESIPFSTITVNDPAIFVGKSVIKVEGKAGTRALIFEERYENGIFTGSIQIGSEVVEEPVQKVVHKGTKPLYAPINYKTLTSTVQNSLNKIKGYMEPNGNKNYYNFKDNGNGTITVDGVVFDYQTVKKRTITMYDGLEVCLQKGCHIPAINHNTFSGVSAQRGLVATHGIKSGGKYIGSLLPMGTIIFVVGYGFGVVADIHGAKNNPDLIDACYDGGEIRAGTATLGKISSNVYIIELP
ncbi:MAG TPA: hypothetical protein DCM45_06650 [Clostridiales bacterium]|nr:hypothetical protein [Clostridiales bacterium]